MKTKSLQDLLVRQLKDLHSAEKQVLKALPRMQKKATHGILRRDIERHERETGQQIERVERVLEAMHSSPGGEVCEAMAALIVEGELLMNAAKDDDVLDASIIAAAQKVEHYEIAGYGTARTYALMLEEAELAELLQQNLDEEKEMDARLTAMAEEMVNPLAIR